jgi:ATP-dependent Clp protease ATP-binding subunit ClpC
MEETNLNDLPLSDAARRALLCASQEAQRFNHDYVGAEHLLLGLRKLGRGIASDLLSDLGLDLRMLRMCLERLAPSGHDMCESTPPWRPGASKLIERAAEAAYHAKTDRVHTGHILLGILSDTGGLARQMLDSLGVHLDELRDEAASRSQSLPRTQAEQ